MTDPKSKHRYTLASIKQHLIDQGVEGVTIEPHDAITLVDENWLNDHGYGCRTTRWRKRIAGKFPQPVSKMSTAA
jgi:hypothetical protein